MNLLDTTIHVHHGFLALRSAGSDRPGGGEQARRGQINGLCGAAVPGELHLVTGLRTGMVHVLVEVHDAEPPLGDEWEEAVEVAFATAADDLTLHSFQGVAGPIDLPPGAYRVRYCARGMQAGRDQGASSEPIDHYLLQFWPGSDRVVRRTSEIAAHWHGLAAEPAPPLAERVATVAAARAQRLEAGGDPESADYVEDESESLVARLTERDPALVVALNHAQDGLRRSVAVWAAEDALTTAGMLDLPWVEHALAALHRGDDPFVELVDEAEIADPAVHEGVVVSIALEDEANVVARSAFEALNHARGLNALGAACGALHRPDPEDDVLSRVRVVFPELSRRRR